MQELNTKDILSISQLHFCDINQIVPKKKHYIFLSLADLKHAATRIQACFRGHVERKKVTPKEGEEGGKSAEVDIDEITKKVSEELGIDLGDPELNKAATKIQATFRGHKTRATKPEEGASN